MAADMKEIMMDKGDKLALGAAVLLLVGYAAYAFGMSNDADLTALDAKVKQADAKIKSNPAPTRAKVDYSATTKPWQADATEKPAGQRSFVSMFKTKVIPNVKGEMKLKVRMDDPRLRDANVLALSSEPREGSPTKQPTGRVLCSGSVASARKI